MSVEHIVPSKLGGGSRTLTCSACNNTQGTKLDSHLIEAMKAMDSVEGKEPITTVMTFGMGHVLAEMYVPTGCSRTAPITLNVIRKASNPAALDALRTHQANGLDFSLRMSWRFIPERYWRGAIRSAYLAVFCTEGYKYVFSDGGTAVRAVLNGDSPVQSNIIMEAFPEQEPPGDLLVMPHSFSDAGECFAVLLSLRSKRTRYLAVLLPGKTGCDWNLLGRLHHQAPRIRIKATPSQWDSELIINLGYDPISEFRKGRKIGEGLGRMRE